VEIITSSNEPLRNSKLVDRYSPPAVAALLEEHTTKPMKLLVVVVAAVSFSNLLTIRLISNTTSPYAPSPFPFLSPSFAVFIEIQIRLFFIVRNFSAFRNLYITTRLFLLHSLFILNSNKKN
jgi:hypothetical protein